MKATSSQETVQDSDALHYFRRDEKLSRLVYKSQVVADNFGPRVARIFMVVMKIDDAIVQRLLHGPKGSMRR